jgi:hypothetical protein
MSASSLQPAKCDEMPRVSTQQSDRLLVGLNCFFCPALAFENCTQPMVRLFPFWSGQRCGPIGLFGRKVVRWLSELMSLTLTQKLQGNIV